MVPQAMSNKHAYRNCAGAFLLNPLVLVKISPLMTSTL
jgi:hypothetical protein